jgi:acyl carrier protein
MADIEQPIMNYIASLREDGIVVTPETSLLESGLLDSINLVQLIQFLEERFGMTIPDADLGPEMFETVAAMAAYVRTHTTA